MDLRNCVIYSLLDLMHQYFITKRGVNWFRKSFVVLFTLKLVLKRSLTNLQNMFKNAYCLTFILSKM